MNQEQKIEGLMSLMRTQEELLAEQVYAIKDLEEMISVMADMFETYFTALVAVTEGK